MPDKDAILRGLNGLPQIDDPGVEGGTPPEDDVSWKGQEHQANFWVTRERKFAKVYVVLRTTGDSRGTALVERDFVKHLGQPATRSSEIAWPPVYSTYWKIEEINRRLPNKPS